MSRYPLGPNAQAAVDEQKPGRCAICDKPIERKATAYNILRHEDRCRRERKTPYARARTCGAEDCKYQWCQLLRADFRWRKKQARFYVLLSSEMAAVKARSEELFAKLGAA